SNKSLETDPRRDLECPRTTRTKYLTDPAGGLPEPGIEQIAAPAGEVRNVEQVEDLSDQIHSPAIVQFELTAYAQILRQKRIAELKLGRQYRQATIALTGTLTDGNVSLTSSAVSGQVVTLVGAITRKSNFPDVFSGTYTVSGGCADGDQGNVTGFSVYSVTGNWAGNLTTAGGGNIHWSAQLAQ